MNETTGFTLIIITIIAICGGGLIIKDHFDHEIALKAIEAGLIQKIDPQTLEPIWTKP